MPLNLSDLTSGEQAYVVSIQGDKPLAVRLLDMGFVPGTPLKMMLSAPSGDPMVIRLRGYTLSLRHSEAACIRIAREAQP